ncbi:MAG: RdgB/HAM1 family non-canonical purine NTP pyrophosphatase [Candidatus Pacebacteria bacterium]|nr:RdgB/HAM1 family non-canonical purine NTP pyrophosphatase [Candidatus Paceibacterota bacterium]
MKLPAKIVIASHNSGKVREIGDLLAPFKITCLSAGELGLPEPEETGKSFVANAELKALAAARASGMAALADDSGLEVTALRGAPGIYSARWAGPDKDFDFAMKQVEEQVRLTGCKDMSARFVCALSLALTADDCHSFVGTVDGNLTFPPRGKFGFGYDPIFVPLGEQRSFGEFDPAEKHAISHRAKAFAQLVGFLNR